VKRICIVTAVPSTVNAFLREHIGFLSEDYHITVVTNLEAGELSELPEKVSVHSIQLERKISLYSDLTSLLQLRRFFKKQKFDLILSVTPKAGLLTSIAGCFASVPIRIHWFTGQVWATRKGVKRSFLKFMDQILAFCITDALVDSHSQCEFLVSEGVLKNKVGSVLGQGSISGVDTDKFRFEPSIRAELRVKLKIDAHDKVVLFLGRLNRDKGVYDLITAFEQIEETLNAHLVLVGPDEESVEENIKLDGRSPTKNLHFVGHTNRPEKWLSVADIFALPSYREGFGTSVIEAASVGLPSVSSRIYGLTDAVEENVTGLMHEPGNTQEIRQSLERLLEDDELRTELADNAKDRVLTSFKQKDVSQRLLEFIEAKLR
jgi:glycosyltransferase involved in cell wall biosynthesis